MISENDIKDSRILIIDDEQANVTLIEKILELDGYQNFVSTSDSTQAVELFQQLQPHLVLLDLNMPVFDGFDVMQQLSAIESDNTFPSILVLTAQTDRETRIRALTGGAKDYVHKPFDRVELLSRIRNQLEVKRLYEMVQNQNNHLEEKVASRTRELQETRLEVIHRLGLAAEYRDNETGLHIIRMSKVSSELARAVGMDAKQCELILNSSPMHDIGKLGIPDSVLLKPGKLNSEEWDVMKTHTLIGAQILSGGDTELLEQARLIAMTHHEKWDGSGYPNGLSGEDIPLVGRIVALADVFDALTSERPYKKAWPVQQAVDYIKDMSGSQFDPALVDIFISILPKVQEISARYREPDEYFEKAV
ncbi:MAG: response regulator [Gammaproteobacteria bacterium]|nr:response regulator [Gammaproteobacteria bacterium]